VQRLKVREQPSPNGGPPKKKPHKLRLRRRLRGPSLGTPVPATGSPSDTSRGNGSLG